jgi:hypothetical protein
MQEAGEGLVGAHMGNTFPVATGYGAGFSVESIKDFFGYSRHKIVFKIN